MTRGELITNCIKLMNDNAGEQIDPQNISSNEDYEERTTVIIPSINRALIRLAQLKKLPVKNIKIPYSKDNVNITTITVDEEITKDILSIKNVYLQDRYGNIKTNISYFIQDNIFILPNIREGYEYTIFYNPRPELLKDNLDSDEIQDTVEINYPDEILNIIPYFVKADLYEEDDPQLAMYSRNLFESYAAQLPTRDNTIIRGAVDVYGLY